jgi:hypothetical protein
MSVEPPHHGGVLPGTPVEAPPEAVEEDHVDLVSEALVELAL